MANVMGDSFAPCFRNATGSRRMRLSLASAHRGRRGVFLERSSLQLRHVGMEGKLPSEYGRSVLSGCRPGPPSVETGIVVLSSIHRQAVPSESVAQGCTTLVP
eukprot:557073-Pyramimonas_sp.AAC.1